MNPLGKQYTLPTVVAPSWQNIEGGIGLFAGMFAGLATLGPVAAIAFAAGGAFLGGSIGRARMRDELKYGREIHSPSIFNKTALAGLLTGMCAAMVLVPLVFPGLPILGGLAAAALIGGGAFFGSATEYLKQREDFARAKERIEIDQMKQVEKDLGLKIAPEKPQQVKKPPQVEKQPELADNAAAAGWSQRTSKQDLRPGEKQPDFRASTQAPASPGKGGIA